MSFPIKDAALATYAQNWADRIGTGFATFGLSNAQATTFTGLNTAWQDAYATYTAAVDSGNRSKSLTSAKNAAKADLLANGRMLYAFVQSNDAVSDANRDLLGVVNRKTTRSPVPPPSGEPTIKVAMIYGRNIRLNIAN